MMSDVAEMLEFVNVVTVGSVGDGYDAFCGEFRPDNDANELVIAE